MERWNWQRDARIKKATGGGAWIVEEAPSLADMMPWTRATNLEYDCPLLFGSCSKALSLVGTHD
jgi:hypothetical protein